VATRQPLRALRRSICLGREHVALAESLGRAKECAEPLARSLPEAIARREILETERREASLRARAASQAPSDFRATMSLAIPTPINRILRLLRLLRLVRDTPLSPTQREQIDPAVGSADTRLDLLNDILGFYKIEAVGWA
jgi:signal transduction histidine kinase